jgi:hypothetical protein
MIGEQCQITATTNSIRTVTGSPVRFVGWWFPIALFTPLPNYTD